MMDSVHGDGSLAVPTSSGRRGRKRSASMFRSGLRGRGGLRWSFLHGVVLPEREVPFSTTNPMLRLPAPSYLVDTVIAHLEQLTNVANAPDLSHLMPESPRYERTAQAEVDSKYLTPVKEALGDDYSYEKSGLVRFQLRQSAQGNLNHTSRNCEGLAFVAIISRGRSTNPHPRGPGLNAKGPHTGVGRGDQRCRCDGLPRATAVSVPR